jgi:hypothetical protein
MTQVKKYDGGFKIFGHKVGAIKHLADRYKSYLSWFQFPLLLYTAFMATINKYPNLFAGHVVEYGLIMAIGFVVFSLITIYIDWKIVFPSEKSFIYSGTPWIEEKFDELRKGIEEIKEM